MASFRTTLTTDNMDIIMYFVRSLDLNPSEVMNLLLEKPSMIIDARSELDEKEKCRLSCKKQQKT